MTSQQIDTKLPCGGRIKIHCARAEHSGAAVGEDDIDIVLIPEVYCVGRYVPGKNCPWLHVLWKFYEGIAARQKCGVVDAEAMSGRELKTKIFHSDGTTACVFNTQVGSGCVVWRGKVFQDAHFGAVACKGPDEFDCCNDVKTWHSGIIAFFRRLFGRKARMEGK